MDVQGPQGDGPRALQHLADAGVVPGQVLSAAPPCGAPICPGRRHGHVPAPVVLARKVGRAAGPIPGAAGSHGPRAPRGQLRRTSLPVSQAGLHVPAAAATAAAAAAVCAGDAGAGGPDAGPGDDVRPGGHAWCADALPGRHADARGRPRGTARAHGATKAPAGAAPAAPGVQPVWRGWRPWPSGPAAADAADACHARHARRGRKPGADRG
mmetsp:Transcript_18/g.58  ORF Transcript_18/g.58 Transcript_18/m.58 type:complete len:211 (-) Transcript_18:926-1558(-)